MKLVEAFGIKNYKVTSLVGGGGKTTIMFALAKEIASRGGHVITTTTTKIYKPLPSQSSCVLINKVDEEIIKAFLQNTECKHVTIANELLASGKLKGVAPCLVDKLANLDQASNIIVEADGAARKPLKAPNNNEPVIPFSTSLVVAVVGIDSLGCRLNEENVFRAEIASRLVGLEIGEIITAEMIASLLTHPQGIAKGTPAHASIICFINKVESEKSLMQARHLAATILKIKQNQVARVVIGSAQAADPVIDVLTPQT